MDDHRHVFERRVIGMRIVVVGGSTAGLSSALLLARAGHAVTVVDQNGLDPAPDVEAAASVAFRASAPQVVQPHALLARGRQLLAQRLPDVLAALLDAGALEAAVSDQLPPTLHDRSPRPGDDELAMILTRRSTVDWILLRAAVEQAGITLVGGGRVTGLLADTGQPPRVRGVTSTVGTFEADVVVDASGRRSSLAAWLAALGTEPVRRQLAECGLAYYSRHYRRQPGASLPGPAATRTLLALDEFTAGMWAADNGTMLFAIAPLVADRRFRTVTDPAVFTTVLRTVPAFAAWLDVLEPISDIYPMGGLHNTLRRLVVDGTPVMSGLFAVGDSVCTTNPTLGRGMSLALQGAADLTDVLAEESDLHAAALALDRLVSRWIEPFFVDQARNDATRLASLRQAVFGDPGSSATADRRDQLDFGRLRTAAMVDPVALRAFFRLFGMLDLPDDVYGDRQLAAHVDEVSRTFEVPRPVQPSRAELLAALDLPSRSDADGERQPSDRVLVQRTV